MTIQLDPSQLKTGEPEKPGSYLLVFDDGSCSLCKWKDGTFYISNSVSVDPYCIGIRGWIPFEITFYREKQKS